MIPHHYHVATELTALTKKGAKFKWTPNCQAAFDMLKLELAKCIMLTYPNFSKPFKIYTDASKLQLSAVISQDNQPLAFYSYKLSAQTRYTVIELERLSIAITSSSARCTHARNNWNLLPHGNRKFPNCFRHHSTSSIRWRKNFKKLSINSQRNKSNTFTMSNSSFISRSKLLFPSNFRQDLLTGIMSSYFIREFLASLNK